MNTKDQQLILESILKSAFQSKTQIGYVKMLKKDKGCFIMTFERSCKICLFYLHEGSCLRDIKRR